MWYCTWRMAKVEKSLTLSRAKGRTNHNAFTTLELLKLFWMDFCLKIFTSPFLCLWWPKTAARGKRWNHHHLNFKSAILVFHFKKIERSLGKEGMSTLNFFLVSQERSQTLKGGLFPFLGNKLLFWSPFYMIPKDYPSSSSSPVQFFLAPLDF